MRRQLVILGITVVLIGARQPKPSACDLLSAPEVAGFLKVPTVRIDSLNSGMNELTKVDFCSWYVKVGESEGVMLKLRRAPSADEVVAFIGARIDDGFSAVTAKPERYPDWARRRSISLIPTVRAEPSSFGAVPAW